MNLTREVSDLLKAVIYKSDDERAVALARSIGKLDDAIRESERRVYACIRELSEIYA